MEGELRARGYPQTPRRLGVLVVVGPRMGQLPTGGAEEFGEQEIQSLQGWTEGRFLEVQFLAQHSVTEPGGAQLAELPPGKGVFTHGK